MKYILIFLIFLIFFSFTFSEKNTSISYNQSKIETNNIGHFDSVTNLLKHPQDDLIISIGKDEQIILWNFNKNSINSKINFNNGHLTHSKISPDGNFLIVSNLQGNIFLINYNTFELLDAFNYLNSKIIDIYFIDNFQLIIVYQNKKIIIYDIFKKEKVKELSFEIELTNSSSFENNLVVSDRTGVLHIINKNLWSLTDSIDISKDEWISSLAFIDANYILTGSNSNDIKLIDINNKKIVLELKQDSAPTEIFSNSKFTAVGFRNGEIKVFSKYLEKLIFNLKENSESINTILIDNSKLISGSDDSSINIINMESREILNKFSEK